MFGQHRPVQRLGVQLIVARWQRLDGEAARPVGQSSRLQHSLCVHGRHVRSKGRLAFGRQDGAPDRAGVRTHGPLIQAAHPRDVIQVQVAQRRLSGPASREHRGRQKRRVIQPQHVAHFVSEDTLEISRVAGAVGRKARCGVEDDIRLVHLQHTAPHCEPPSSDRPGILKSHPGWPPYRQS